MISVGVIFAVCAMFAWGFGDFFIQRASRKIGIWQTLFFIGLGGFIGLFPFVRNEISGIFTETNLALLFVTVGVALAAALFYFEALKVGKIAVIEPITAIELPIAIGLSIALAGEILTPVQFLLMGTIFIGIVLVVTEHHSHLHYHKRILEKGVILALIGAVGMGLNDLLMGLAARNFSPILSVWLIHSLLGVISLAYLIFTKQAGKLVSEFRRFPVLITAQSLLDNAAWVFFALAVQSIPIAITATIGEAYIAIGVLLGIFLNREKLKAHQLIGTAFAIGGALFLAIVS